MTMRVEFTGMPGSGKTTVLRHIVESAPPESRITAAYSVERSEPKLQLFGRSGLFAAAHPLQSFQLTRFCWRSSRFKGIAFRLLLRLFAMIARSEQVIRSQDGSVLIADQGILQGLASIAIPAEGPEMPDPAPALRSLLPGVDALIHLECPPELVEERLAVRDKAHRLAHDANEDSNRDLRRFREVLDFTVGAAADAGIPLLVLAADALPAENAERARRWLSSLGKQAPGTTLSPQGPETALGYGAA